MTEVRASSRSGLAGALFMATACAVAVWGTATSTAHAQQPVLDEDLRLRAFDLQLFTPPAAPGATFLIERPEPLRHLSVSVGLHANVATDALRRFPAGSDQAVTLVGPVIQGELLAAIGLFEYLEVGLALPIVLASAAGPETRQDPMLGPVEITPPRPGLLGGSADTFQVGASDLRLSVKVPLVRGDFSLAARVGMGLPLCAGESCGSIPWFASQRYWSFLPELVASGVVGPIRISGELGYRMRQRREVGDFIQDDELQTALGVTWTIIPELAAIAEAQWRIGLGGPLAGRGIHSVETPLEIDLGARILPSDTISIEAGIGTGAVAGYGAPAFRGFLTARLRVDASSCAGGPEDNDGFQDGDFCADPDNDADGVPDVDDRCANDAEDADGFQDEDGCAELDNDGDGILDGADTCPTSSEDDDEHQDEDGCPEPDNDEDGIADGLDQCPMDPEDDDDFQDEDGCPEPGPRTVAVTVSDTRILIGETIYFEFDTEVIRPVSMPLLDQVAEVIGTLNGTLRIRVEGHTDTLGGEAYNVDLSFRRARAVVEYLASRGVARDRLEYRGYGAAHPVAPNDTPQGRSLNRRVEFTILRPGEPVSATRRRPR